MENKDSDIACPICNKEIIRSEIESHVDRCLFLNSNTASTDQNKRSSEEKEDFTRNYKKSKNILEKNDQTNGPNQILDLNNSQASHMCFKATTSSSTSSTVPLAEQMRPSTLEDYVGQSHVLGHNKVLRSLLEQNVIPSMILWGPPGCGKTSLAHVISKLNKSCEFRFVKLSATMSGINDVKDAVKIAKNELSNFKRKTILFMDEIHRFNKLQQDIFLSHVESGCIVLIGATTENPSFSLNSALLSRCRVIVLEKLSTPDLLQILNKAIDHEGGVIVRPGMKDQTNESSETNRFEIEEETVLWLAEISDGDARIALNSLQMAVKLKLPNSSSTKINLDDIKDGIKRSHLLYDRKGDQHYDTISALHKSIRGSDDSAALYWLTRMLEGGEDPIYIARRLVVCASEDIGIEDDNALPMAVSAMQACKLIGMPECGLFLAHVATYLARAPKSREVYNALTKSKLFLQQQKGSLPPVPLHLRNAPTKLMKDLGYGAEYKMADTKVGERTYMPEGMENISFFDK
uniref:UBZ4-type domain-containing protein n=1 Tax=Clastoptera arizonana TaxID=38151 RepID=A0A1B6C8Q5_9HEMI